MPNFYRHSLAAPFCVLAVVVFAFAVAGAQSVGNSGSVNGSILDSTGAVVPVAKVEIRNPVSGFDRSTISDNGGNFAFTNIPFNNYHLTVVAAGFMVYAQDVEPRSSVPVSVSVTVWPANDDTLNERSWYPDALFRFEYVARVVEPSFTVSLS